MRWLKELFRIVRNYRADMERLMGLEKLVREQTTVSAGEPARGMVRRIGHKCRHKSNRIASQSPKTVI